MQLCILNGFTNHQECICIQESTDVHLGKPKEVMGDGGGAALDFHQWELIFSCQQDVFLVVEHRCQVHSPNGIQETQNKDKDQVKSSTVTLTLLQSHYFQLCWDNIDNFLKSASENSLIPQKI